MSPENSQSKELEPGLAFERFIRMNTRPNPNDIGSSVQRAANYKGAIELTLGDKLVRADSIILQVSGDLFMIEDGELPNTFSVTFRQTSEDMSQLEFDNDEGIVRYHDWNDPSSPGNDTTTELILSVLSDFIDAFYDQAIYEGREEVDFNNPYFN
jgi:hypothetical protein